MQLPPLTFLDLSLLLTVGAIILLITAELASPHYGLTNLAINKKKIRNAALPTGLPGEYCRKANFHRINDKYMDVLIF